jgi:hypothetical protein
VATGLRLRGAGGRLTARLIAGGIDQLEGCSWVLIGHFGGKTTRFEVEEHAAYSRGSIRPSGPAGWLGRIS